MNQHQSVCRPVFFDCRLTGGNPQVAADPIGDAGQKERGEWGRIMLDEWAVPIAATALALCLLVVFIYLLGKPRDRSIFAKPTHHKEIKNFRNKLP